jgi:hypothetical protein
MMEASGRSHFIFFLHFSWRKSSLVVKTPSDPKIRNRGGVVKVRGLEVFRLTRSAGVLQLARSVILVISEGFVDFNTGGLPIGWCDRRSWVGGIRLLGSGREKGLHGGGSSVVF